jgi:hypothetical protein
MPKELNPKPLLEKLAGESTGDLTNFTPSGQGVPVNPQIAHDIYEGSQRYITEEFQFIKGEIFGTAADFISDGMVNVVDFFFQHHHRSIRQDRQT